MGLLPSHQSALSSRGWVIGASAQVGGGSWWAAASIVHRSFGLVLSRAASSGWESPGWLKLVAEKNRDNLAPSAGGGCHDGMYGPSGQSDAGCTRSTAFICHQQINHHQINMQSAKADPEPERCMKGSQTHYVCGAHCAFARPRVLEGPVPQPPKSSKAQAPRKHAMCP